MITRVREKFEVTHPAVLSMYNQSYPRKHMFSKRKPCILHPKTAGQYNNRSIDRQRLIHDHAYFEGYKSVRAMAPLAPRVRRLCNPRQTPMARIQCEFFETFNGFPFFQANDKISSAKGVACVTSGKSKPVRNGMLNSLVWPPRSIILAQKRSQKQSDIASKFPQKISEGRGTHP